MNGLLVLALCLASAKAAIVVTNANAIPTNNNYDYMYQGNANQQGIPVASTSNNLQGRNVVYTSGSANSGTNGNNNGYNNGQAVVYTTANNGQNTGTNGQTVVYTTANTGNNGQNNGNNGQTVVHTTGNNAGNTQGGSNNGNMNYNSDCGMNTVYTTTQAVAVLIPAGGNVTGSIVFDQPQGNGAVTVSGTVYGLGANSAYGLHIHEYGNLADGCEASGDHFNPDGYPHGDISDSIRHAGDLGNIVSNAAGVATFNLQSNAFTLNGDYDVTGRAINIHSQRDDGGRGGASDSTTTGNSGSRLACGVIGINAEQMSNNDIQQNNQNNRNNQNNQNHQNNQDNQNYQNNQNNGNNQHHG